MTLKQQRIAERIRTILSELMLREISDPRLQNVTITEVRIDAEMAYANVYVNALADENRRDEVMSGLDRAKGFLRREVGQRVRLRVTPELHFHWDTTLEYGERMNRILSKLDIPPADDDDLDDNPDDDNFDDE